jgi:hypothetical protein
MSDADGAVLEVGSSGRFRGTYHAHWEWSRFELPVASRWRRRVLCELVSEEVPWPATIRGVAGAGRRGPTRRFAVTVDADVVARGNFGHLGTLRWRLLVRRWVDVKPLP